MFDYRPVNAPYPGLRPFEPHESEIFFGRGEHVNRLLEILQQQRFLAVIGPSGCGKSSLVRAGLLPGLASGALGTGSDWRLALFRPGGQPLLAFAQALISPYALGHELVGKDRLPKDAEDITADAALIAADLRRGISGFTELLLTAKQRRPQASAPFNLLVLVDQFEELFTYPALEADGDEAEALVNLLLAARADEASRVYVALTMRTDFLGHCVRFLELPEAINHAQYLTPRLHPAEMERAILGPARVFRGDVDAAVVTDLIDSINRDSDQLPLLQHAMARMWLAAHAINPDRPFINAETVVAVGGVAEALNRHADAVYAALPLAQQHIAETLFRAITERREGGQDVRRPQSLAAIADWSMLAVESLKPVIETFAAPEVSFLHYGRELTDHSVIDLTHEALIRQWASLRGWVADEHRRGLGYQRWSQRAAESQKQIDSLLTGGELARALEWWNPGEGNRLKAKTTSFRQGMPESSAMDGNMSDAQVIDSGNAMGHSLPSLDDRFRHPCRNDDALSPSDDGNCSMRLPWNQGEEGSNWQPTPAWAQRYTDAEGEALHEEFALTRRFLIESRDEEQRRREEKQRQLEQQAEDERRRADHERKLADSARISEKRARRLVKIVAVVALLAMGLAVAAFMFKYQAQTAEQQRTVSLFDSQLTHASLLARVEDYAEARQVLKDSAALDSAIAAARLHTRNLLAGAVALMGGQAEQVYTGAGAALIGGVKVSPDGKLLAAAGERGTLVLFDAATGQLVKRLDGHDAKAGSLGTVRSVVFDPQGRWLLSGGDDARIIRWSLPAGEKLGEWQAAGRVRVLALSPDGTTLASSGDDGRIMLWNVADGHSIRTLEGHKQPIGESNGLAFSPNGLWLASAAYDQTARIWDWHTGKTLHVLEGHNAQVIAVAFSPDGKWLATSGADRQVILWDAATGHPLRALRGHQNVVSGLAFSADSNQLWSASLDNTLRLWDVDSGSTRRIYQGHAAGLTSVSVQGNQVYTAAKDATVRRWSLLTPEQWVWETGGSPQTTAISPDGLHLALGMENGSLLLYSLPDGKLLSEQADAHGAGEINRIAFNSDGSLLATAGMDRKAKLWRIADGKPLTLLHTLEGHTAAVYAVAFSPNGLSLATAAYDGQIGLFEVASGTGHLFPAHQGKIASIAFNAEGKRLLSAGINDFRLRLGNLDDLNLAPQEIAQAQDRLLWASLSPDGQQVAAVGREQTVSLYDLAKPATPRLLVGHEQGVYRAIYSPDGRQLATVSADMTVRLWDVDRRQLLFTLHLPTAMQFPSPLWDFDFRCTAAGDCWIAVPLTVGRLALYRLPYTHLPEIDLPK